MSHLIARILLAILMFPLASLAYLVIVVMLFELWGWSNGEEVFIGAGLATWAFLAGYWYLLWRKSVRFTGQRIAVTLLAAGPAAGVALGIGAVVYAMEDEVGVFVGSTAAPLLWIVATIFIWRETAEERGERLSGAAAGIVCPVCGYNLTGLTATRCPECGKQFTIDELLASQPNRVPAELEAP
jgi:peptidoglycan/LPS O-acetylase OafA/YrhL